MKQIAATSVLKDIVYLTIQELYQRGLLLSLFSNPICSITFDDSKSPFLRVDGYVGGVHIVIPRLFIGCSQQDLSTKDKTRWEKFSFEIDFHNQGTWFLDNQWCDDIGREAKYEKESNRLRLSHFKLLIETMFPDLRIVAEGKHVKGGRKYKLLSANDENVMLGIKGLAKSFYSDVSTSGLRLSEALAERFTCSLLAKPFVVLTGLSGSGKTKLAQSFTDWIGIDRTKLLIPVGADWTNSEKLLGYPDALQPGKYVMPDTGVLKLLLDARDNPKLPFFLILDEMNLSHVERYFADFLSAMESGEDIKLHGGTDNYEGSDGTMVPPTLKFPKNLFVIGTMNVDETTYMFSPKVLDRAQVIEFRVSKDEMAGFLDIPTTPNLDAIAGKGAKYAEAFLNLKDNPPALDEDGKVDNKEAISAALKKFFEPLAGLGAEFGYRTAGEVIRFCRYYLATGAEINDAIDAAIVQKLLPKLHGSQQRLAPVLRKLKELASTSAMVMENGEQKKVELPLYKLTCEKIDRMLIRLKANGFTSFSEA